MSHLRDYAVGVLLLSGVVFSAVVPAQTLQLSGPDGQVQVEEQALGQYGPTTRTDTLWRIATKVRPDNKVTVYQVMQALFDANPHAFTSANFNSLERRHILTVPTRDVMISYPPSEAKSQAQNHDSTWVPTDEEKAVKSPIVAVKQIEAPTEPAGSVDQQLQRLQQENQRLRTDLDGQKELVLQLDSLRAELDDNAEQMAQMVEQNAILQRQLEQLSHELSTLQTALDEQQSVNRLLEQELDVQRYAEPDNAANSPVVNEPVEEPVPSFWQNLSENTLALIAIGPLTILLIAGIVWLIMRRRHRPITPNPIQDGEMIKPISPPLDPLTEMVPDPVSPVVAAKPAPAPAPTPVPEVETVESIEESPAQWDNDVMSFDDLLQDEELNATSADSAYSDDNAFEQALAESSTASNSTLDSATDTPEEQDSEFDSDDFIDIDKLLAESENSPGLSATDIEEDTISPTTDPLSDEGGYHAKLDLARAYIEIEDVDSAKALLKEVETEGNPSQRTEAETLLKQL